MSVDEKQGILGIRSIRDLGSFYIKLAEAPGFSGD